MRNLLSERIGDSEADKRAIRRARKELFEEGLIGSDGEYVWMTWTHDPIVRPLSLSAWAGRTDIMAIARAIGHVRVRPGRSLKESRTSGASVFLAERAPPSKSGVKHPSEGHGAD